MPVQIGGRPNPGGGQSAKGAASYNPAKKYPLPNDTLEALQKMAEAGKACRNRGLLFDRYIGYLPDWRLDDRNTSPRKEFLKQICETEEETQLREKAVARWRMMAREAGAVIFSARPEWRFVTGMGRKGPLEVGFVFHRLYGFPIIPGSGLKGLALAQARDEAKHSEEIKTRMASLFGSEKGQGQAIFFDAMPLTTPILEIDIINTHYPAYYQKQDNKNKPPANWQSPQPVFFLTLSQKSQFLFAVGGQGAREGAEFLKRGMAALGAGAKTSAGYGYWDDMNDEPNVV